MLKFELFLHSATCNLHFEPSTHDNIFQEF